MQRHLLWVIFISTLIFSCASHKSPDIYENGINYQKYGFAIAIPDGWEATTKIPSWVDLSRLALKNDRIMLVKSESKGFIYIGFKKSKLSLFQLKLNEAKLRKNLTEILEKRKEDWNKDIHTSNYYYKITPYGNCPPICHVIYQGWNYKDYEFELDTFNISHHDGGCYTATFILCSHSETSGKNLHDYELITRLFMTLTQDGVFMLHPDDPISRMALEEVQISFQYPEGVTLIWLDRNYNETRRERIP